MSPGTEPAGAGRTAEAGEPGRAAEAVARIGVRGGRGATVDRTGRVRARTATLDWWIGADDRWYRPAGEVAVRQQRLEAAPVVETRLRLPGGDAVHRAYGARVAAAGGSGVAAADAGDCVVVEVENRSPLPLVLVLVLAPGRSVAQQGPLGLLDGVPLVVAVRPPSRSAAARGEDELFATIVEGRAEENDQLALHDDRGDARLAGLWPLAHGATLRFLVPLDAGGPGLRPGDAPAADQVARGWRRQLEAGVVLDLPDPALTEAVLAARAELLLGLADLARSVRPDPWCLGRVVRAAALFGHDDAVAEGLDLLVTTAQPTGGAADLDSQLALVSTLAELPAGAAPDLKADRSVELVAEAVALFDQALRRGGDRPTDQLERCRAGLADAARILQGAGQPAAAEHVRRLHPAPASGHPEPANDAGAARWASVQRLLTSASPTWTWADPRRGPELLVAARQLLLEDASTGTLPLLPGWPERWRGSPLSFHRLPSPWGPVSSALRWHGDRPALLWEIEGEVPGPTGRQGDPPVVTAPALDQAWTASGWRGEALLSPVPRSTGATGGLDEGGAGSTAESFR